MDFHAIPLNRDKGWLSRIKPTRGTSWGLVQVTLFLLGRKRAFFDVLPITVKRIAEDFEAIMEEIVRELSQDRLRLVMVFGDREFAVNQVVKFLLKRGVDFVIAAKAQMYRKYQGRLERVEVRYGDERYTGFLCVRHPTGAYLIILRKEDGGVLAFLVRGEDVHA